MKVEGISSQSIINSYQKNNNRTINKVQRSNSTDSIEISDIGKSLKNYSLDVSDVNRSATIEEIRNKISNGTYNIDAKFTAQSILDYIGGKKI